MRRRFVGAFIAQRLFMAVGSANGSYFFAVTKVYFLLLYATTAKRIWLKFVMGYSGLIHSLLLSWKNSMVLAGFVKNRTLRRRSRRSPLVKNISLNWQLLPPSTLHHNIIDRADGTFGQNFQAHKDFVCRFWFQCCYWGAVCVK